MNLEIPSLGLRDGAEATLSTVAGRQVHPCVCWERRVSSASVAPYPGRVQGMFLTSPCPQSTGGAENPRPPATMPPGSCEAPPLAPGQAAVWCRSLKLEGRPSCRILLLPQGPALFPASASPRIARMKYKQSLGARSFQNSCHGRALWKHNKSGM